MMESRPRVSVITPTYNRADFIGEAVESVLAQTLGDFELLVVDDGSTDNTREIMQPYLEDPRVHYFEQENRGQSGARNTALAQAKGEFICFLDSDNTWEPDKLERQLVVMELHPEVDIVYGDIITINEQGDEISRDNMRRYSGRIVALLLRDNFVSINTSMIRRHCFDEVGNFDETERFATDYDLWLRFSAHYRFHYLPAYLTHYRMMENQLSSDKTNRFRANQRALNHFLDQHPDAVSWRERLQGWSHFYARKARNASAVGRKTSALLDGLRSVLLWPFAGTGWRAIFRAVFPGRFRAH